VLPSHKVFVKGVNAWMLALYSFYLDKEKISAGLPSFLIVYSKSHLNETIQSNQHYSSINVIAVWQCP
jgi:hypothetical protein